MSNLSKRTNRCRSSCSHKQIPETFLQLFMLLWCPFDWFQSNYHGSMSHVQLHMRCRAHAQLLQKQPIVSSPTIYCINICFPLIKIHFSPILNAHFMSYYFFVSSRSFLTSLCFLDLQGGIRRKAFYRLKDCQSKSPYKSSCTWIWINHNILAKQ